MTLPQRVSNEFQMSFTSFGRVRATKRLQAIARTEDALRRARVVARSSSLLVRTWGSQTLTHETTLTLTLTWGSQLLVAFRKCWGRAARRSWQPTPDVPGTSIGAA